MALTETAAAGQFKCNLHFYFYLLPVPTDALVLHEMIAQKKKTDIQQDLYDL